MNDKPLSNQKSSKEIMVSPHSQKWYQSMIEECKAIIVETEFSARIETIKGKWLLGERILAEELNFKKAGYGEKTIERVAADIGISPRETWRCIQFQQKYPQLCPSVTEFDVNQLPGGKNISWRKIVNKYLPEPRDKETGKCPHSVVEEISFLKCKKCKESLGGHSRIVDREEMARKIKDWANANNFPEFPLEFNEEKIAFSFIPVGKESWESYLKKNSLLEIWKVWKIIESKEP